MKVSEPITSVESDDNKAFDFKIKAHMVYPLWNLNVFSWNMAFHKKQIGCPANWPLLIYTSYWSGCPQMNRPRNAAYGRKTYMKLHKHEMIIQHSIVII